LLVAHFVAQNVARCVAQYVAQSTELADFLGFGLIGSPKAGKSSWRTTHPPRDQTHERL